MHGLIQQVLQLQVVLLNPLFGLQSSSPSSSACHQHHIIISMRERERLCCLTTEARRPIRDGDEWEKGDRRVKPRNRRQPGRPRLPWTAARTKCYGSVRPALHSDHHTMQLLSQLLCRTVTKTMSVALPLGNN